MMKTETARPPVKAVGAGGLLPDVLAALPPDTVVHLGSKTSFMDVAPASVMTEGNYLDELSGGILAALKNAEARAGVALRSELASPPRWSGSVTGKKADGDVAAFLDKINTWRYRVGELYKLLKRAERKAERFVPLRERRVVEVYNRFERDGTVVRVEGDETGPYWGAGDKGQEKAGELVK